MGRRQFDLRRFEIGLRRPEFDACPVVFGARPAALDSKPVELYPRRFDFDASRPKDRNGLLTLPVLRRELPAGPAGLPVPCVALRLATAQFGPGLAEERTGTGKLDSRRPVFDLCRPD